jgi:hypothetical protein
MGIPQASELAPATPVPGPSTTTVDASASGTLMATDPYTPDSVDALQSPAVRTRLQQLALDVRQIRSASGPPRPGGASSLEELALPSPSLQVHVLAPKRRRADSTSSMAAAEAALPMTFEIALDTVMAFMQHNLEHLDRLFTAETPVRAPRPAVVHARAALTIPPLGRALGGRRR